jgi:uncharacterized protein YidB (DUF937 family)
MSGFFNQVLQSVLGSGQPGQASPVNAILQQILSAREGDKEGIAAIIAKFQNAGFADQVQSWIGTGPNAPISPHNVDSVFSPQQIQGWAQQAGVVPDAMRDVLAQALPQVVDHLTPDGKVPDQTPPQMIDLPSLLGRLMGGGAGPSRPA